MSSITPKTSEAPAILSSGERKRNQLSTEINQLAEQQNKVSKMLEGLLVKSAENERKFRIQINVIKDLTVLFHEGRRIAIDENDRASSIAQLTEDHGKETKDQNKMAEKLTTRLGELAAKIEPLRAEYFAIGGTVEALRSYS